MSRSRHRELGESVMTRVVIGKFPTPTLFRKPRKSPFVLLGPIGIASSRLRCVNCHSRLIMSTVETSVSFAACQTVSANTSMLIVGRQRKYNHDLVE